MESFEGMVDDTKVARDGKDAIIVSASRKAPSFDQPGDECAGVSIEEGTHNSEAKLEPPCGKTTCKTRSSSIRSLVNIESSAVSLDDIDSVRMGASINDIGSSTLHPDVPLPSDDASDGLTLQINSGNYPTSQSQPAHEDTESRTRRKIQYEPTLPICLKFEDVKYKVPVKGEKISDAEKYILHGISGSVYPGEVLALMGPSGGGKTTLLNVLSGRVKFDSGTITYNDQPYSKSLKRRIGFVLQDDVTFPHLTVKETLTYAALLRLPNTLTMQQKKERAMSVISELGLERCQNTVIGGTFLRGISGGERKRVCIANEILLNPSLLFLDEPTSGLDSTTALQIVQMLHNIAQSGTAVVTTIHQPSSRLFSKFDKLILLGKGSSLYYGKASEAMLYFSSIGCSPLIAMNPAEFLIDLANGNIKDKSVPSDFEDRFLPRNRSLDMKYGGPSQVDVHEYLVEAYAERVEKLEKTKLLQPVLDAEPEMQTRLNSREWGATWWDQFSVLFKRGFKERRHEYFSCMRVTQVLSTAIIMGLLWWRSDASSPKGLEDQATICYMLRLVLVTQDFCENLFLYFVNIRVCLLLLFQCMQAGLLFFISVFWAFFPMFTAIFTFPQERVMLALERSVGMYRLSAFFLARMTSDLPLDLIFPVAFLVIVYLMAGLKPTITAFSLTMLTVFVSVVASQGLGLTIGAALMDVKKAATLASVIIMASMLSGGFFIQKVPAFMSWVRYISFTYHTYRLLLKIHYGCAGSDTGSGSCNSPFKGLRLDWDAREVGTMIAIIVGYRLLAYAFLRRMKLMTMT
ncbi:PREDICTED: ABC transporter G family member 22 isoform X1 [Theobroma cacao]|uniref:ABC transporter G family member 22 isoform X1 n=1 Tax=Theobroma cacao TaxID=3641 RepID=A0AB32WMZ4_THECC|nr:PREDICTED: ABC transporter G family member 22 isoform X1 [Theobroma cacao]